jgi:hypothetical protein
MGDNKSADHKKDLDPVKVPGKIIKRVPMGAETECAAAFYFMPD